MTATTRYVVAGIACVVFMAAFLVMHRTGVFGLTMFVLLPIFLGAVSSLVIRPKTDGQAAGIGALVVTGACLLLVPFALEGLICIAMVIPLAAPLGSLGAVLVFWVGGSRLAEKEAAMLLLLPIATLTWDLHARPPVFEVHTAITVNAPPEKVWKHVVTFSDLPEPTEWYFHTGLAYPKRARILGSGPGAIRYCEFSTGPFVEPIETWDEPRLLAFRVTQNPAPLEEWSPYAHIAPKHLHGYFVSEHGQFRLTPLPSGGTLLEGTTWYRHGLWPAQYWRLWSDAIIHRIHLRVLNQVKKLAEQDAG